MKILISTSAAATVQPNATKEQAMLALHHLNRAMSKSQDKFALIGNQLALQHKISETGYKNLRLGFFVFTFEGKKLRTMQAQDPCKRMPVVKVGTKEEVHKYYERIMKSYNSTFTKEGVPTFNAGASSKLNKEALKTIKKQVPKVKLVDNTFDFNGMLVKILGYRIPNPAVATLANPKSGIVFSVLRPQREAAKHMTLSKFASFLLKHDGKATKENSKAADPAVASKDLTLDQLGAIAATVNSSGQPTFRTRLDERKIKVTQVFKDKPVTRVLTVTKATFSGKALSSFEVKTKERGLVLVDRKQARALVPNLLGSLFETHKA